MKRAADQDLPSPQPRLAGGTASHSPRPTGPAPQPPPTPPHPPPGSAPAGPAPARQLTSPTEGSCSPRPTMRMQSACRMQRWVHGVSVPSAWYSTIRWMSSCCPSQLDSRYSWILEDRRGGTPMPEHRRGEQASVLQTGQEGPDSRGLGERRGRGARGRGRCSSRLCLDPQGAGSCPTQGLAHLSRAAEPRRCFTLSLANSRTGPENTNPNYRKLPWQPTSRDQQPQGLQIWLSDPQSPGCTEGIQIFATLRPCVCAGGPNPGSRAGWIRHVYWRIQPCGDAHLFTSPVSDDAHMDAGAGACPARSTSTRISR